MADKKSRDPKMAALEQVYEALKDLDPADQEKVLTSLNGLLAIRGSRTPPAERGSERTPDTRGDAASRPTSLIELMQDKAPQTNAQRIALFAYYRERSEGFHGLAAVISRHISRGQNFRLPATSIEISGKPLAMVGFMRTDQNLI